MIVGADDAVVAWALKEGTIFGAYNNVLMVDGVSAMWNGVIGTADEKKYADEVPSMEAGGLAVHTIAPNNLAHAASHFIFFEKGTTTAALSESDALSRLVGLSDESKSELVKVLVQNKRLSIAGGVEEIANLLC